MYAEAARVKTTPSDAESATKKTDSNREPNSKESVRVDVIYSKSAAATGAGREDKLCQQDQMVEVKSSTLEGQQS